MLVQQLCSRVKRKIAGTPVPVSLTPSSTKTFLAPVSLTSFLSTRFLSPFHLLVLSELPLATLCTTLVFSRPTSQRVFVRFGLCPSLIRQLLYSLWLLGGRCLHRPLLLGRVWHCGGFDLAAQVRLIASPTPTRRSRSAQSPSRSDTTTHDPTAGTTATHSRLPPTSKPILRVHSAHRLLACRRQPNTGRTACDASSGTGA